MKKLVTLAAAAGLLITSAVIAESTPLKLETLQFDTVHEVAERSILVRDDAGKPVVALLRLDDGDFLPPHGAGSGPALVTVLSGDISWGDGTEVNEEAERLFSAGSIIILPPQNDAHWAAARNGDVLLQVTMLRGGVFAPGVLGTDTQ